MADKVQTQAAEAQAPETTADSFVGQVVTLADKDKLKKLRTALGGDRVYFETDESGSAFDKAGELIEKVAAATENFYGLRLLVQEGCESADRIAVATLGKRLKAEGGAAAVNGIQAITVFAQPTVAEFLANPEAEDFVRKLIEREAADVAFGKIRGIDTHEELEVAFAGLPKTVSDIVITSRESGSGLDTDAFNTLWGPFRSGWLKEKAPALVEMLPQKPDVIKAIRSKSYALANPRTKGIEERGFFVRMAEVMIKLAPSFKDKNGEPNPQDASTIQAWLDERESVNIEYKEPVATADKLAEIEF